MDIKILGTRGEIEASAPYHSKHSGVLIDKKFLFDLGEKEFLKENPDYIIITHLHPDHAFFILKDQQINTNILLYAPEKTDGVKVKIFSKKKTFDSYRITPIPTIHSLKVKTQAYLIEKDKKRILYTGDLIWIEKKYHKLLKDLDLVITEGSFLRKGGMVRKDETTGKIYGHNGIPDLVNLFKRFTHTIVLMHFGSWFYKNIKKARSKIQKLAKEHNIEIIVGYDGLEISI